MIGILLVTHNGLGNSLVDCVRHVMGGIPVNLKSLSVLAEDDPQHKLDEARRLVAELDTGSGVLLLSDLFGATPSNIAQQLCAPGRVEGIAGVSLPMLLRAISYSGKPLAEAAQKALDGGRDCVVFLTQTPKNHNAATGSTDH